MRGKVELTITYSVDHVFKGVPIEDAVSMIKNYFKTGEEPFRESDPDETNYESLICISVDGEEIFKDEWV